MPIRQELDLERNLTVLTVEGQLGFDELRSVLEQVYARPEYTTRSLFDMRTARPGGLSASEIQAIVGLIGARRKDRRPSKWAVVAQHDVHFGLSRMFEAYASDLPVEVRVFYALDEATDWLEEATPGA